MRDFLAFLVRFDGWAFLAIGLVVLVFPSPQPGLARPVSEGDLQPISQTRRLLAAMFIACALLVIVLGRNLTDLAALKEVAAVRVAAFLLVIVLLVLQWRSRRWKKGPLAALFSVFSLLSAAYLVPLLAG